MRHIPKPPFSVQSVVPDLPEPSAYMHWLEDMHRRNFYSNFGPLYSLFSERLLIEFGRDEEACVPCASATAGLSAAMIACASTGPVLIPAFTFPATLGAVHAAGLEPIVMDVCRNDWLIRPDDLDIALGSTGAGAVILVAPFGVQTDFSEQIAVCRRRGAAVIIDCAAGMGVERLNPCIGEGVFEVFSLHATKPFGVGEGGIVFCDASKEADVRSALNFGLGSYQRSNGPDWGFNGKISEFHVAVGLAQLERYRPLVKERQSFAGYYSEKLEGIGELSIFPRTALAPWQIFPVALPTKHAADQFVELAAKEGVEIRRYYRPSLSQWPNITTIGPCVVSEDIASRMVALPIRRATQDAGHMIANKVLELLFHLLKAGGNV